LSEQIDPIDRKAVATDAALDKWRTVLMKPK
jgi:hypothetical protein